MCAQYGVCERIRHCEWWFVWGRRREANVILFLRTITCIRPLVAIKCQIAKRRSYEVVFCVWGMCVCAYSTDFKGKSFSSHFIYTILYHFHGTHNTQVEEKKTALTAIVTTFHVYFVTFIHSSSCFCIPLLPSMLLLRFFFVLGQFYKMHLLNLAIFRVEFYVCVCVHSSLICNSPNSCAYLLSLCLFVELRFVVFPCAQNARRFISFEKLSTSGKWKYRRCCVVQLFSVVVIFFFVNTILCHTANNCPKYYRYVKLVPFLIDFFCKCSEMVCFPVF